MVDFVITWMCHNPLQAVAVLAGGSAIIGLLLVPGLAEVARHGHPRV